ncbi:SGNH/GDSL hydrolase family protein [Candidatus Francisella endociliophora]|nr:SGNH/GDSL hydrolase family protein [Francisella sp. FSC1006]
MTNTYADARSNIVLENECNVPVEFKISGDNLDSDAYITLSPHSYHNAGEFINDKVFFDTTSEFEISYTSNSDKGLVKYHLSNSWNSNHAMFEKKLGNIFVDKNNLHKKYKKSWHSYSSTLKYVIPTFTISSCSINNNLDLSQSEFNDIDRVIIFGDSLTDTGTLYSVTKGLLPKSTPYDKGMFSNGDIWSLRLKNMLLENNIKTSNYAVGGATVVYKPEWADVKLPYNLKAELTSYNIDKLTFNKNEKRLGIFLIGANDILTSNSNLTTIEMDEAIKQVTDKIISSILEIDTQKNIIIGLPDLSVTLESKRLDNQRVVKYMTEKYNEKLAEFAEQNQEKVKFIDLANIFNNAMANIDEFNKKYNTEIRTTQESCWHGGYYLPETLNNDYYKDLIMQNSNTNEEIDNDTLAQLIDSSVMQATIKASYTGQMCDDPQHYFFWDEVHPTLQVQKAIYLYILEMTGVR